MGDSATVAADLITFPCSFFRPPLLSNNRMMWQEKARVTKAIRYEAFVRAKNVIRGAGEAGWSTPISDPINIILTWAVTIRRVRDTDAAQPTLKAWIDGMTVGTTRHPGAGLILDDRHEIVVSPRCVIEEGAEFPSCRVEISRAP